MRHSKQKNALFAATAITVMSLASLVHAEQTSRQDAAKLTAQSYTLDELKAEAARHTVNIYGP